MLINIVCYNRICRLGAFCQAIAKWILFYLFLYSRFALVNASFQTNVTSNYFYK